jgi:hypothetical protein
MLRSLILRAEKIQAKDGLQPLKPAKQEDIALTIRLAKEKFNVDLPRDYIEFLRFRNGFWFEGLSIYHAKYSNFSDMPKDIVDANIIDENISWRKGDLGNKLNSDYLFFGQSNLDLFALNLKTNKYEQQDRSCRDVVETFPNFTSMMIPALTVYIESMENRDHANNKSSR